MEGRATIHQEMSLYGSKNQIPNTILRQCFEETVQKTRIEIRKLPKKYSMMIVQTKRRVYKFRLSDISQQCFLATPDEELVFEKRLRELAGRPPEEGNAEVERGREEGEMIVGTPPGRHRLTKVQRGKKQTRMKKE